MTKFSSIDLSNTLVKGELEIENIETQDLVAKLLTVEGIVTFKNLKIKNNLNLENSNLAIIECTNVCWPTNKNSINFSGMAYRYFNIKGEDNPYEILLNLINNSIYSDDTYSNLEALFERQGLTE